MTTLADRITVDPAQCGGRPCVRGLRIRVTDVLDLLASGLTAAAVVAEFRILSSPSDLTKRLDNQRPPALSSWMRPTLGVDRGRSPISTTLSVCAGVQRPLSGSASADLKLNAFGLL